MVAFKRQQIGLAGDVLDQRHDFADLLRAGRKPLDHDVGAARLLGGLACDLGGARHLLGDLADRSREFFGCRRNRSDIGRGCGRSGGGGGGLSRGFLAAAAHRGRHALHFAGGHRDRLDDMADLALEAGGEFAHRRVALLFGLSFGFGALDVGAGFGGVRSFGFGGLLRGCLEQVRELVGKPDQDARLDDENTA